MIKRTIVWFRRDLRITDHEPLALAAKRGAVIPVFILDNALLHHPETGSARVEFMLACLRSLDQDLRDWGGRLIVRHGDPVTLLPQLIQDTQAEGIYAYIDFERIYGRVRDARLNQALAAQNMKIRWFEPAGTTPALISYPQYRNVWFKQMQQDQVPTPTSIDVPLEIVSEPIPSIADLGLEVDVKPIPLGGTHAARRLLQEFLQTKVERYYWQLSYPGATATSGLSPYLKFGVISVRECYQTVEQRLAAIKDFKIQRSRQQFISRLRWGSGFAQRFRYLPQLELRSLYRIFDEEGWAFDPDLYHAWQEGQTGFPIVDAAARCLCATGGWQELNFRVRAIYASFLSNLLGIDWRYGALHFMQHLIDGDCPIDHYQWAMQAGVTHCLDKNWTRIYNPEQSAIDRCDQQGTFIKRWLPELAHLHPDQLGTPPTTQGYCQPILNYKTARQRRVKQLDQQRSTFRQCEHLQSYLTELPVDVTPFGSERVGCDVGWAQQQHPDLFPPSLDVCTLDSSQIQALRTWLVAHVEIKPHPARQRSIKPSPDFQQLSLFSL